jgi:hypothetical protein
MGECAIGMAIGDYSVHLHEHVASGMRVYNCNYKWKRTPVD